MHQRDIRLAAPETQLLLNRGHPLIHPRQTIDIRLHLLLWVEMVVDQLIILGSLLRVGDVLSLLEEELLKLILVNAVTEGFLVLDLCVFE